MHDPDTSLEMVLPASDHAIRGEYGNGGKDEAPFHGNLPLDAARPARVGAETAEHGLTEMIHEKVGAVAHGLQQMLKEVEHNLEGDLDELDAPAGTIRIGQFFFFNGKREPDAPVTRPTNWFRGRVYDLVRAGRCCACQGRRAEEIALQLGSEYFERLSLLTILGNCVTMSIVRQPIPH